MITTAIALTTFILGFMLGAAFITIAHAIAKD